MTELLTRDSTLHQLLQMALNTGRKLQSSETGFIHIGDRIPIVENFLFALALLRSRTADHVLEGKEIIRRLLHFQAPNGNFPTFLDQYPETEDYFLAADLIAPLHWILAEFKTVLGALSYDIEKCKERIVCHFESLECNAPAHHAVTLDPVAHGVSPSELSSPRILGPLFVACQLAGIDLPETLWNSEACCYAGPGVSERQDGYEPEVTLYDLFMCYQTRQFPQRLLQVKPVLLWGALIRPTEARETLPVDGEVLALEAVPEHHKRWRYLYKHVWGDLDRVHSLVCQGGNIQSLHYKDNTFTLDLAAPIDDDHREKQREVSFYIDRQPLQCLVNGKPANTFELGDEVVLNMEGKKVTFRFELARGEGHFMGHLSLGNRPAQLLKEPQEAYDWQLFLRTIRRSEDCSVTVSLQFS